MPHGITLACHAMPCMVMKAHMALPFFLYRQTHACTCPCRVLYHPSHPCLPFLAPSPSNGSGLLLSPGGEFAFVLFGEAVSRGIMGAALAKELYLVVALRCGVCNSVFSLSFMIDCRGALMCIMPLASCQFGSH